MLVIDLTKGVHLIRISLVIIIVVAIVVVVAAVIAVVVIVVVVAAAAAVVVVVVVVAAAVVLVAKYHKIQLLFTVKLRNLMLAIEYLLTLTERVCGYLAVYHLLTIATMSILPNRAILKPLILLLLQLTMLWIR